MQRFIQLTKRNMLLYLRDRGSVCFSLLSMFIVIMLMMLFLSDINIQNITELLSELPSHDTANDEKHASLFILAWTAAGIIPINAVMVTLSVLTSMIRDKTTGRIQSIYTAPIRRSTIACSYITAAGLCSILICVLTLGLSELYLCIRGMEVLPVMAHLKLSGMILVNSFAYAAMMYLLATLVRSEGAWSGIGTIIGTLVGFLGGIYLPVGQLADGLTTVMSCTPVIYSTVMFRSVMTEAVAEATFADAPAQMLEAYREVMGITYEAFGHSSSPLGCIIIVAAFGAAFMIAGVLVTTYTNKKDR